MRDLREFVGDDALAGLAGFLRGVVAHVLLHRHDGVGLAVRGDAAVLGPFHEAVARAAGAVAGRAEGRKVVVLEEPADDFVERAAVVRLELFGLLLHLLDGADGVAAHGRAGAAGDLGDAELEGFGADALAFAGRHDHAGVGHGHADERDDLEEEVVGHGVLEGSRIDVVGRADARHGDRVRTDAPDGFKMLGVHEQADEVVAAEIKPEEHAETHVVDAAFHGAVVRLGVVGVVGLRSLRMQLLVGLAVVGLLEELVGADLGLVKLAIVLDRRGGDVHVEAADGAVLVLDRVDGLDGLEDVLDRIVLGVLARLKEQALVAEVLERDHLVADLLLRELLAHDALVLGMVRAVRAGVDAVVRKVERREEHDAAAVDVLLHLDGGLEDPVVDFLDVAGEQHGGFAVGQALELGGLVKDAHEQRNVRLVLFGVGERVADFLIVDELFRYAGLGVVNGHFFSSS